MHPNPVTGNKMIRKDFSAKIYLLSNIIDKVFMYKTGNKDKFTELKLNLTTAFLLREEFNWAGALHELLKTAILSVA